VEGYQAGRAVQNYCRLTNLKEYEAERERRREIGLIIDAATAETTFWHADMNDPYDILDENLHNGQSGPEFFARNPGGEWVHIDDLPKATHKTLRDQHNVGGLPALYEVGPDDTINTVTLPPAAEHSFLERTDPCVLVQGAKCGDAQFYGEWLLAAGKAEAFWKEAYADQDFQKEIDRVCVYHMPDFGTAATALTMRLRKNRTIVLEMNGALGDDFAIMAAMGFFLQKDSIYQMSLPSSPTSEEVRAAILKYAKTEDSEFIPHPEYMVTTLPFSEATVLQNRLRRIDWLHNANELSS
jgi:hypothetical protein